MYWVHWKTRNAKLAKKSRAVTNPAAGLKVKPEVSEKKYFYQLNHKSKTNEVNDEMTYFSETWICPPFVECYPQSIHTPSSSAPKLDDVSCKPFRVKVPRPW